MGVQDFHLRPRLGRGNTASGRNTGTSARARDRCVRLLADLIRPAADGEAAPLATRLVERFGSLPGVLCASPYSLREVLQDQPLVRRQIKLLRDVELHLRRVHIVERPMLGNWQALLDYVRSRQALSPIEEVRVLYLNTRNVLIREELMATGSIDQAPFYVREIIRRGVELHAAAMIVVHNHPSGDAKPSRADIDTTRLLATAARSVGLALHDHLVVAENGHASLKSMGVI